MIHLAAIAIKAAIAAAGTTALVIVAFSDTVDAAAIAAIASIVNTWMLTRTRRDIQKIRGDLEEDE